MPRTCHNETHVQAFTMLGQHQHCAMPVCVDGVVRSWRLSGNGCQNGIGLIVVLRSDNVLDSSNRNLIRRGPQKLQSRNVPVAIESDAALPSCHPTAHGIPCWRRYDEGILAAQRRKRRYPGNQDGRECALGRVGHRSGGEGYHTASGSRYRCWRSVSCGGSAWRWVGAERARRTAGWGGSTTPIHASVGRVVRHCGSYLCGARLRGGGSQHRGWRSRSSRNRYRDGRRRGSCDADLSLSILRRVCRGSRDKSYFAAARHRTGRQISGVRSTSGGRRIECATRSRRSTSPAHATIFAVIRDGCGHSHVVAGHYRGRRQRLKGHGDRLWTCPASTAAAASPPTTGIEESETQDEKGNEFPVHSISI